MHPFRWDKARVEGELRSCSERVQRLRQSQLAPAAVRSLREWFRIHHTYHSNAIEGNRLTLAETRAVVEDGITIAGKPLKDHTEAVNLADAVSFVEQLANRSNHLGETDIRTIHGIVLRGLSADSAGRYRNVPVRISGSEHVPPMPAEVAPSMERLGAFLNGNEPSDPILRASIAHAWLEGIHPFVDGNGRTGRLLANLVLMRDGYPVTVLRVEERARYYEALARADAGELTDVVLLTTELVQASLDEYERITGELQAREPELRYLAERLDSVRETASPEFVAWLRHIDALHGALGRTAQELSGLQKSRRVSLLHTAPSLPRTEQEWQRLRTDRRSLNLLEVSGPNSEVKVKIYAVPPQDAVVSGIALEPGCLQFDFPARSTTAERLAHSLPLLAVPQQGGSRWSVVMAEPKIQPWLRGPGGLLATDPGLRIENFSSDQFALALWRAAIEWFVAEPTTLVE